MPDTPKGPLPDTGSTADANRERAMLERHLLVRRRGHEPLFPGLWADDRWIPGIALADTWAPVWAAPGMPFLGRVPLRFTRAHVVAALGIGTPPKLSSRQRKEWAAAGRDPARTWQDACDLPIDHPRVALLTSRVLDDLAREHGEAPRQAREVHAKVRGAIDALRAILESGRNLAGASPRLTPAPGGLARSADS